MSTRPSRGVRTPLPGPRVQAEIARGGFDMQAIYRASIFDEEKSQGTSLVDLDGNVFLDLFASFALGSLGYNHPALVEAARTDAFVRASVNPTSTPFLTSRGWRHHQGGTAALFVSSVSISRGRSLARCARERELADRASARSSGQGKRRSTPPSIRR